MNKLSDHDRMILEKYKFTTDELAGSGKNVRENDFLLCVKGQSLDLVRRTDVTSWEIFKSFFGFGKLASCKLQLSGIAKHLEKFDLTDLNSTDAAYKTIHGIASRMLISRKAGQIPYLWLKLSTQFSKMEVETISTISRQRSELPQRHRIKKENLLFHITPLSTFNHLIMQIVEKGQLKRESVQYPRRSPCDTVRIQTIAFASIKVKREKVPLPDVTCVALHPETSFDDIFNPNLIVKDQDLKGMRFEAAHEQRYIYPPAPRKGVRVRHY